MEWRLNQDNRTLMKEKAKGRRAILTIVNTDQDVAEDVKEHGSLNEKKVYV